MRSAAIVLLNHRTTDPTEPWLQDALCETAYQAEVAALTVLGEAASYAQVQDATALKVAGAGVWSAGAVEADGAEPIVLHDGDAGQYRRLLVRDGRLVGAMLYGETADAPWYLDLISTRRDLGALRAGLAFGPMAEAQA